jgi:hypothetical protein
LVECLEVCGILGIKRDGSLVAVVGLVVRRVETALESAKRIAGSGALDLDDIGTEVTQMHGGSRAR